MDAIAANIIFFVSKKNTHTQRTKPKRLKSSSNKTTCDQNPPTECMPRTQDYRQKYQDNINGDMVEKWQAQFKKRLARETLPTETEKP